MRLNELIGQYAIKQQAYSQLNYCRKTGNPFPHTLFIASAGQGKSSFANALAQEIGGQFVSVYGPSIQNEQDLNNIFFEKNGQCKLWDNAVIFLDEIHAIPMKAAEHLYTLMENFKVIRNGVAYDIPPFTLLAGTTEPHLMSKPLRDRFVNTFVFEPYTNQDVADFIRFNMRNDGFVWVNYVSLSEKIGKLCRYTPRLMKNLHTKMTIYCTNKPDLQNMFVSTDWEPFLKSLGYNSIGLTTLEDKYMRVLGSFDKASLNTIANIMGLKPNMISTIIEPSLIASGYVELAFGGRHITEEGRKYYPKPVK